MYKKFEMELAGRTLRVDVDRVAKQANGAVLIHYGDTVVLSTATASKQPREGIDFFPLSVEYNEKMYELKYRFKEMKAFDDELDDAMLSQFEDSALSDAETTIDTQMSNASQDVEIEQY